MSRRADGTKLGGVGATVVIVQARMGSTRLPGKVMLPLFGRPVLWHVLGRAKTIAQADAVVCACPDETASRPIIDVARALDVSVYCGHPTDVLDRYHGAALEYDAGVIVRITADCPLIDPRLCDHIIALREKTGADYASNVYPERTWRKGLDCEVFTFAALAQAYDEAGDGYDREHVCPWMQRNLTTALLRGPGDDGVRMTLDTHGDYERLKRALFPN